MHDKPARLTPANKTVPRTASHKAPQTSREIRTSRYARRCPECGHKVLMPCLECAVTAKPRNR